jgi:hypothetical protein
MFIKMSQDLFGMVRNAQQQSPGSRKPFFAISTIFANIQIANLNSAKTLIHFPLSFYSKL